jgi:hypothetical protein
MKNTQIQPKIRTSRYTSENENFWRHHIATCSTSGVSRAIYCKQNNINYDRFGYWMRKLSSGDLQSAKPAESPSSKPTTLIPVQLKPQTTQNHSAVLCTLSLKNGHMLQIHDQQTLLMLLERCL